MKALVTGGTSGIGKSLCQLLAHKGYEVLCFGSKDADLRVDRTPILQQIEEHLPPLIINCAGVGLYGYGIDHSFAEQRDLVEVNALAAMEITLFAAKLYKEKKRSLTILNVSSLAGERATPLMSAYGASKAFLSRFSEALDYELKPFGIRVLTSAPGMVRTPFMNRAAKKTLPDQRGGMDVDRVARLIYRQIEKKSSFCVIDLSYRIIFWCFPFLPKRFIMERIYSNIAQRL